MVSCPVSVFKGWGFLRNGEALVFRLNVPGDDGPKDAMAERRQFCTVRNVAVRCRMDRSSAPRVVSL